MNEKELTELIARLKNQRIKLGYSYQDLANITNISKSTLQRYETGFIKKVPITQIDILARALGVSPAYLMGWDKSSQLTAQEETHIKKYRQLDDDGKEDVDDYVDMKLAKLQRKAEEEELKLG